MFIFTANKPVEILQHFILSACACMAYDNLLTTSLLQVDSPACHTLFQQIVTKLQMTRVATRLIVILIDLVAS